MKNFEYYLGIANHDIQIANNQNELKSYIASLLCDYDKLQQENQQLAESFTKYKKKITPIKMLQRLDILEDENEQLKMIIEEYERLNKENGRGFKIISVKQYNIDELVKCEKNWNDLKDFLETNWKETQDIWFVKIINKMKELERGVSDEQ